jgi:curli production assembly/transport component CsgG
MMLRKIHIVKLVLIGVIASYMFAGCSGFLSQPMKTQEARLGYETPAYKDLTSMPEPREPLVAAVYKFSDQTGQYKPSLANSWSTAVTQGATTILLRALEESGWFVVIERENLGNLLNERKIIRSSRAQYLGSDEGSLLPPLLFAGIILEGGIISYESNIRTGGIGARYFGIGASGQYREDKVTIYLRAVSTSNGKILKTVYTSKSILSQEISANFFRYVDFKRLLEAEFGYTYNEPSDIAVTEAIEKAVVSLVYEGINDSLWEFKNPADTGNLAYKNYIKEKDLNPELDEFGMFLREDVRGQFGLGANAGAIMYEGDYRNGEFKAVYELNLDWYFKPSFALNLNVGRGQLAAEKFFEQTIDYAQLNIKWLFLPKRNITPLLYGGAGFIREEKGGFATQDWVATLQGGAGVEFMVTKRLGIEVAGFTSYFLSDELDGLDLGKYNDFYWGGTLGLKYYVGKPPLLKKYK